MGRFNALAVGVVGSGVMLGGCLGDGTPVYRSATEEGGSDAGSCAQTIDAYCASVATRQFAGNCIPDWSSADAPSQWCSSSPTDLNRVFVYPGCDGFNLVAVGGFDCWTFYYYDSTTMKLVRVENRGVGCDSCLAGQPGPVVPLSDCLDGSLRTSICASDAAAD